MQKNIRERAPLAVHQRSTNAVLHHVHERRQQCRVRSGDRTPSKPRSTSPEPVARRRHHRPTPRQPPSTLPSPSSKPSLSPSKPTDGECPVGQSKSSIMIVASRPSQIRQGRKPTLIIAATRGEFASSVADKPTFILLRSSGHDRFLLSLIQPSFLPKHAAFISVTGKAWIGRSRSSMASARAARRRYRLHRAEHRRKSPPSLPASLAVAYPSPAFARSRQLPT
ncbi:hypothetical protein ACLOJK_022835, partial [Asimina triloba]